MQQRDIDGEENGQKRSDPPAQQFARYELEGSQRAAEREPQAAVPGQSPDHDAPLAGELLAEKVGRALQRDRFRLVHRSIPLRGDLGWKLQIVRHVFHDRPEQLAAYGEDRAGGHQHRAQPALEPVEQAFVPPVQRFAPADVRLGVAVDQPANHATDLFVGEVAHQRPQRVAAVKGIRVGEDDDLLLQAEHGLVERGALALAARERLQNDPRGLEFARDGVGAVGRTVAGDDDSETIAGIVEGEAVPELLAHDPFFVVRRDDQRDRRRIAFAAAGPGAAGQAEDEQDQGIPRIRVENNADNGEKEYLQRFMHRLSSLDRGVLNLYPKRRGACKRNFP